MAQIVDAAGRVTYRAGRYYGSPDDLARLGLTNPTPPLPPAPPPQPQLPLEPQSPPLLLQNGQPLTQPRFTPLLQQPGLAEDIFSDLAAGKSTEQVAQERGMTREAVISTLAGDNQPIVTQPTSDNGDVRTTVIQDAQGRTVTEYYDFQHGTYYTTVQQDSQSAPVANPVRDESGWKVEQTHDFQTGTDTTTRVDDFGTGDTETVTTLANGTRVETTVAEDGTSKVFVTGPDGKKVELAPWQAAPGRPDVDSPLVRPPELQDFIGPVASDKLLAVGGDQTIPSIRNELAEGRSIDEIAETRGISHDQVVASMQAAGLTVTDTQTSVGHVVKVTEPQGGKTTTYTHDYDHDSTNVTVTKPNGDSTSDSVDGNGVTTHTEKNAETGAQTTHEVDPRSNTTTDITIDADGRRTEVVKAKGADGSEQTTTTVTFNGYQLTTAPDGDKTLTNTSTGDQQTIKAGSVQDSFATLLMEATPNSADPEIARQGQAQKAFAESQLAQARLPDLEQQATEATQAREDAEGKYGTGRPAQPTLNPDGQVIDPIGQPPPGSPGELPPPVAGTQRTSTETPTAINGDNSVKWVPININGAWTWVHPEVARAAAAEAAANSRVIEANSLITASESDLQVYGKTPEFNGAMRNLRSQVNEALAPHNLQWTPSTAPGTLADAQHAQTLAHDAYGQASAARGHYDQAVTSLDQAINQQAAMPFYPDGTTPVATAAGSNYDYDAEVAKGKKARADINKLFSDVDLQTKAGDKAITDFNVSMTGAIDAPPGTLAEGAQPVEIEIGGQKLQVTPEVAAAYNNSGDITALSNGDKPIRVQVDVTRPDGTTGTEWRWVAPDLALQSIGVAQQLRLSEAYNNYFGAVQTDADLGVKLEDFQSRALADYRQRVPYQFDPDGYQNGNGEYTGKLLDSEVVVKDGKLMLRNTYENDVFTGEDGHVLEVALAVNPNDESYTDEMRARPLNQEWMELAGPSSDGNACVASPLSAAKSGVESAALEVNQLIHNGVTENLAAIDRQLPGLRTDYNQLVQVQGTGTAAPPEGTLAHGEAAVPIQIGGQTVKVAPDVAAQVQTRGPSALTESGKPVYVDIEIPSEDEDGTTTQLRGWVSPELALAGVRLTDAETQKSQLTQTKTMLDNSIAYNQMRLRNPEMLTDTTGTTEGDYLERDEQGTLDGIYQGRYQNLLNAGFNNEFEALDDSELSQTIDRTAGIDPTTEDGRDARQKIIDEIHETGGDNAEVRVVPIFYSQEGSASHQTALYAVKTDDGTRYIDAAGQKFDSLEDFQDNNRQFSEDGKLIVPKNLEMTAGTDGRIALDVVQARNVSTWDKVIDPVVGIVGGVATVLSFTPLAPVAAPIAIGSGVYLGTRTAFKQADYLSHGGEWGDKESLMNMGMIAATALPVGGSILRSAGLVRAGIPVSRALPGSIGALPMRSGSVTLAGREFTYTASPYATQVADYTRTAGGLNMAAHGLDATAMAVGAPLVVQSGADLVMHGGDMSGLELANSVLGLGTGVMGTGAGVRTIAGYRPGRGGANPSEMTGQQTPALEPNAIILPGENGGPEQVVVMGTGRSTPDLTPIAGRGNPDIIRVRAEDGQMVDAVVLGDQPASADAIFVPRHGEMPRLQDMAGKTHVLLRDPETGAPLVLPWRGDGNSVPLGLVESRPMLPAGHQPKEIGPAPPTSHTLDQVRGMRQPDKWQAGETYIQELNGSAGQEHFPVPLDPNGPFPVTRPGGRHVDAPVHTARGIEAIEVKTYNLWTTISGAAQMREVPLTRNIQEQINKDVALRNSVPGYEPRWVFLDAPPSAELVQALNDARIIGNIYRHWTPPSAGAQATTAPHTAPREPRVTQATVDGQSGPRLFIADGEGNVSRATFAVGGDGEITPVASDPTVAPEGSTVLASRDTSKFQYTSGKDRAPFPATYLESGPDGSVSLRQDGYEPQSAYLDKTPEGKPLTPEQIQARYQRESEYYSPLEMAERYGPNGPQPPRRPLRDMLPDFRVAVQFRVRMNTGEYLGTGSPTIGSAGFGIGTKTDFGAIGWSIVDSVSQKSLSPLRDALGAQGVVSVRAREYRNITGLQAGLWPVSNQTAFPVRAKDLFKVVKNGIFTDTSGYDIRPTAASVVGKTPDESGAATVVEMEYSPSLKGEDVTLDPHQRDFFGVAADNAAGHVKIEDTLPFDRVMTEFKAGIRLPILASHVDAIDALPRIGFERRPESSVKDTLQSGDVVSREAYDQIQSALGSTNLKVQFAVKDPQAAAQLVEALNRGDGVASIQALVEAGQIDPSTAVSYVENPIESGMRLSAVPGKKPYDYVTLPTGEVRRVSSPDAMLVDIIFNDSNRLPGFLSFNPDKFVTSKTYKIKGKANEWRNAHLPEDLHSKSPPQSRSMQTDGNIYENLYGQYGTPATRYTVSFSPGSLPLGLYRISVEGRAQYKANARSEPRSIAKDRYTTMEFQAAEGETYGLHAPQWLGRAAAAQNGTAFMIPKGAKASLKRFLDDLGEHARPDQKEMIENFRNGAGSRIVDGTFLRGDDAAGVQAFLAGYAERKGNLNLIPLGDHEPIPLGSLVQPEVQPPSARTVRSWSADQIGNLSRAQLAAIEPRHIAQLTSEQLGGLTPGQMALLSHDQIAALRPTQLRALSADQLNGISPDCIAAIPPGRIAGMNPDQIAAFSPLQLREFTSAQRQKITPDQLAKLDARQLDALGIDLSQMRGRQIAKLDDTQLGVVRENTEWDQLSREQLRAIPETGTAAINTAKLTPEQASWLTEAQIAALTRDQFGTFTVNHIEALTRPQVEAITPKQFEEMSAGQFRKFTLEQFGWMSTDQTNALSVQQLSTFKAGYRKTMTPEQRNLVDGALAYSRAKEHQMALDTFGTLAGSSYLMWSSLPPHWMATAGGVSFAFRGVTFTAQSLFPNATAPHTRLGRAINLTNGLSFVMSSPGSAAPLIQNGANPVVNGTFTLGNMIYSTKSTMQGFMGRTAMRLLGDHIGNAAYLGGSIAYTAQNLHSPIGWTSGALFALGSGEFWASAIRTDRLNGKPLPRTEADIAAAAKSDKRWAMADRLALGITFGGGMFLFAWDTLDSEPQDVAGTEGQMPGTLDDPPATSVNPDPDEGVVKPDDTPPPPDPTDTKPDKAEPQFAVNSEIGLSLRESPDAHADRLGVVRPDALVHETGPRETDAGGTLWAPVRAFDGDGKQLQGWVRADYLVAHPKGAQDVTGRFNPELEKEGYQAIIVQNRDSMIGLAINHQKSVSATVALNLEHIADPNLLFAGDRVYLPR